MFIVDYNLGFLQQFKRFCVTDHPKTPCLIGAHMSAQGGAHNALLEGNSIGANTVQFFTANQKTWNGSLIASDKVALWEKAQEETQIFTTMSHDSYLINLGSPNLEGLHKSLATFQLEIERCHQLNITFLNFHPGAALNSPQEACLETIVKSLRKLEPVIQKGKTRLLIETTSGQGSTVGYRFEHLHYLIDRLSKIMPIGVCLDTCHIFAAGYDITKREGWDLVLKEFDEIVGLSHLYALHVNDSLKPLGSRVDRHAALGEGLIGLESFKAMMQHAALQHLPKYLETPGGPPVWVQEIQLLREWSL